MFISSSISSDLEFLSVDHTSTDENSESQVFKNIKFLGEISNNWPNDLFGTMSIRLLNFVDNYYWYNYKGMVILQ